MLFTACADIIADRINHVFLLNNRVHQRLLQVMQKKYNPTNLVSLGQR